MDIFKRKKTLSLFLVISVVWPLIIIAQTKPLPRKSVRPAQKRQIPEAVIAELSKLPPLDPQEKQALDLSAVVENKAPADDAPLPELLDYWRFRRYQNSKGKDAPSEIVSQRLLDACVNRPEVCSPYFEYFPKTQSTYDALYQAVKERSDDEKESLFQLKSYLQLNSNYLREELLVSAQRVEPGSLTALAELDWDAAKPILEKQLLSNASEVSVTALEISRKHALQVGDTSLAENYLAKLQQIVANRQTPPAIRGRALHIAMQEDWQGQEEWFLSLLADPVLSGLEIATQSIYFDELRKQVEIKAAEVAAAAAAAAAAARATVDRAGNTSKSYGVNWLAQNAGKNVRNVIPKIINLVGNADPTVHNAAVSFLAASLSRPNSGEFSTSSSNKATDYSQEIVQALSPWLSNKNWAQAPGRISVLGGIARQKSTENMTGLLAVLNDDAEDDEVRVAALVALRSSEDQRLVPLLKGILPKLKQEFFSQTVIETIFSLNGFSEEEIVIAFEAGTRYEIALEAQGENAPQQNVIPPLNILVGLVLNASDSSLTDGVVQRVFDRVKELTPTEPLIAKTMLSRVEHLKNRPAQLNLVERIRTGDVDANLLAYALAERAEFKKQVSDALYPLLSEGGYAAGFAAVLLGEEGRVKDILIGKDVKAQQALLVSARYVRDKLSVMEIAPLLSNPILTNAAENYLEIENSRAARELIWSRHPNQAWIVGEAGGEDEELDARFMSRKEREKKLQEEVLKGGGVESIFAYLSHPNAAMPAIIVRVKQEEAELSLLNVKGYQKKRLLTNSEFKELKYLTAQPEIEDLRPESYGFRNSRTGQYVGEYLRLNKESSRRILLNDLKRAPKKDATSYEQLAGLFYSLSRTGDFKIRYDIEDKIKGIEVIYANEKRPILGVGMENKELRVYLRNTENPATATDPENQLQWHVFEQGQLGSTTTPPTHLTESYELYDELDKLWPNGRRGLRYLSVIPSRHTTYLTKDEPDDEAGIYKLTNGTQLEKILSGNFFGLEVTPDEQWLIACKRTLAPERAPFREQETTSPYHLVRLNLKTKQEFPIKLPVGVNMLYPHTHLPGSSLIFLTEPFSRENISNQKSFWLDAYTGRLQPATGDLRPLLYKTFIPFQPAATPKSYWVAFTDERKNIGYFGLYNVDNFTFKPRFELPNLQIASTSLWADEASGYVYLTHEGNLLRLPLK